MPKFLNISDLRSHSPKSESLYFFDANVWLYSLINFDSLKQSEQEYVKFFYRVFEEEIDTCKVLINNLLIAEIFNTYMHKIAVNLLRTKKYSGKLPEKFDFKRDFRNRHKEFFEQQHEKIKDDLHSFCNKSNILFLNDEFDKLNTELNIITTCPTHFDFNDHYYYQLLKNQTIKPLVVTNDSDWSVEDLEILTVEKSLLNKRTYI
ncbi:MAG: hypothetical protein ABJH05_05925 [Fulvivirga sp.]